MSLVVQWFRIQLAMQRTWVQSLVRELRSQLLWSNHVWFNYWAELESHVLKQKKQSPNTAK